MCTNCRRSRILCAANLHASRSIAFTGCLVLLDKWGCWRSWDETDDDALEMRQKSTKRLSTTHEPYSQHQEANREVKVIKKFSSVAHDSLRSRLLNILGYLACLLFFALVTLPIILKYSPCVLDLLYDSSYQHSSLVILKVPSSGSTWLTSLLNDLPSG